MRILALLMTSFCISAFAVAAEPPQRPNIIVILDRDAIYWHYPHYSPQGGTPSGAIRLGDWKLKRPITGKAVFAVKIIPTAL